MAPVLRLGPVGTHVSPLGANPLLHTHAPLCSDEFSGQLGMHELPPGLTLLVLSHASQTPFALQWEQPATWHSKHLVPALLGFLVLSGVQAEHLSVISVFEHVLHPSMPPFVASLQGAHMLFPVLFSTVGKLAPLQSALATHVPVAEAPSFFK